MKLTLSTPWRQIRGVKVQVHSLLTFPLEGQWSTSSPGWFIFGKEAPYLFNKRSRASLEGFGEDISLLCWDSNPEPSSQKPVSVPTTLFRLRGIINCLFCDLRSSGVLRSVECYTRIDVSGQPIGPIFNGLALTFAIPLHMLAAAESAMVKR
jgi:hypothetical protein